ARRNNRCSILKSPRKTQARTDPVLLCLLSRLRGSASGRLATRQNRVRRRRIHSSNWTLAVLARSALLCRQRFLARSRSACLTRRANSQAPQRLIENAREKQVHP